VLANWRALLLLCVSCAPATDNETTLRLVRIDPDRGPLYLNQPIRFLFDDVVDPLSVTSDTVRIVDAAGLAVPGKRLVRQYYVEFVPHVPTRFSLDDGSFQPGARYRAEVASYPLANAVRGLRGKLLRESITRSWKAVDPDALPAGKSLALMPSSLPEPLFLLDDPRPAADGSYLDLAFNRPVYPPSVLPSGFQLRRVGRRVPIALRSVEVLPASDPTVGGRVVRLVPAAPLERGHTHELVFTESGPRDYRLGPLLRVSKALLERLRRRGAVDPRGHRLIVVQFPVGHGRESAPVDEVFAECRAAANPDALRLPEDIEGVLQWGPDGLRLPALPFDGFKSMGVLQPGPFLRLKEGAFAEIRPRHSVSMPARTWDFDRFVVPKGTQVHVMLDAQRTLTIRVAGRFEVAGELVFRVTGGAGSPRELPGSSGIRTGDARVVWKGIAGRVEFEVGGICRLTGRIVRRDTASDQETGRVPGFLLARGPFIGGFATCPLQPWLRAPAAVESRSEPTVKLLGVWGAASDWMDVRSVVQWGGIEDWHPEPGLPRPRVLVQGREAHGDVTAWVPPRSLPAMAKLAELRFAVLVRGAPANGKLLLRELRIR
jgi:hypothetical protein